jgi:hypothetical protein
MESESVELLHATPGRIRLRIAEVKANPALAREIQRQFATFKGVRRVDANPLTGSVLVLYDPAMSATIAEMADRLIPGLDVAANGPAGPGPRPAATDDAATTGSVAEKIMAYFKDLNAQVAMATGGPDLKVLLPMALFAFGVKGLITSRKLVAPTWYDFLWFSFGTFLMLNRNQAPAEAPDEEAPPAHRVQPASLATNGTH